MAYIGLDVGTSGCKAAILTGEGQIIHSASEEYSFCSPRPGYVELDPELVWTAVKKVLKKISPWAGDVKNIAVSSIGESMVMLDKDDHILYNGITYLDQRCVDTLPEINRKISARELHKITGVSVNQMFTLNKFLWFRKHMPGLIEKTEKFFLFGDYITYCLSGARAIDPSSASRTMFFDANTRQWSGKVADLFDIPIEKFSTVTPSGTIAGTLRPGLAEELGLSASIQVVMGIHDQCAATLGSGSLFPGEVMLGQGSTESINCVVHKSHLNDLIIEHQLCFEPYIDSDHFIIITGNLTHGTSISWFVNNFCRDSAGETFDYADLYRTCPDSAGDVFFLPYLSRVNLMDPNNHALGGFLGIDVTVTKPQMFRALLEGLSFETRVSMEIFQNIGVETKKITASGGVSNAELYMQMKSDIIRQPIHILSNSQAGIMGLGIICAVSAGDYSSCREAADAFVSVKKTYQPRADYENSYRKYQLISARIKALYDTLAEL